MAYRNLDNSIENQIYGVGICFDAKYPGIRRACILDLAGGVMSISLGVLLLIIECCSAYINETDVSVHVLPCHHIRNFYHLYFCTCIRSYE